MAMTTIKSYTDIEQSKKLAEILPLESADMWYPNSENRNKIENGFDATRQQMYIDYKDGLPCWSLTALFSVLPDEIEYNHFLTLQKEKNEYLCCYEDINGNSFRHSSAIYDNPVDAAVEMTLKLHELNLL